MTVKLLVVGDIHIGKKFNTYKPNKYSNLSHTNLSPLWTQLTINYLNSVLGSINPDIVVFLGDIFDKPSLRPEEVNLFTNLLNRVSPSTDIFIIVGNHDTTEPQNPNGTLLSIYDNKNNVKVFSKPTIINESLLMLPYCKKEQLSELLPKLTLKLNKAPIIFSHNDFYINDSFIMTEMINVELLKELFGVNTIIFNGHIHNFYYEPSNGIFFTGSVSPTSFKDSPMSSGICYVEIDISTNNIVKFKQFNNPYIIFVTIDNPNHIPMLEEYLVKYREFDSKVVLRFSSKMKKEMESILAVYSDIVVFYKDHLSSEDVSNSENSSTTSQELITITNKIKSLIDLNFTKHDITQMFQDYIQKKYGFKPNDIIFK